MNENTPAFQCPDSERLQQWSTGGLNEPDDAPIATHVEQCRRCMDLLAKLHAADQRAMQRDEELTPSSTSTPA